MNRIIVVLCLVLSLASISFGQTAGPQLPGAVATYSTVERADSCNQVGHSHSTGATITLTAGQAGSQTGAIFICGMDIQNVQGSAAVTAAVPTFITTTGINGSPQYMVASGSATAGLASPPLFIPFTAPLKSATDGTNVTFVLPAFVTNQTVSVNVYFRTGKF